MIGGPLLGRLEEGARLGEALLVEVLVLLCRFQGIPPGRESMHLDAARGVLRIVNGKGGKMREAPISPTMVAKLRHYCELGVSVEWH